MNNLKQETDFTTTGSCAYSMLIADETSGSQIDLYETPLHKDSELIKSALFSTTMLRIQM